MGPDRFDAIAWGRFAKFYIGWPHLLYPKAFGSAPGHFSEFMRAFFSTSHPHSPQVALVFISL